MYGVRAGHPGAQAYYDDLIAMYAAWGVDFIKCDDIANTNMYPHAPYSGRAEIEYLHKRDPAQRAGTSYCRFRRARR